MHEPACDWRRQLAIERRTFDASCADAYLKYHLIEMYRGRHFRTRERGAGEALFRARALDAALQEVPLVLAPDQKFFGGIETFRQNRLPGALTELDYARDTGASQGRGRRTFRQGFDHTLPHYPQLLELGLGGIVRRIDRQLARRRTPQARQTLGAMKTAVEALSRYIRRAAAHARSIGREACGARLERIAEAPPARFADALQLVWITHVVLASEGRYADALGRIDQYLLPLYEKGIKDGTLTREAALDDLCHIWTKIEGMHEVTNICIGGLKPDGTDATNDLSYLCIEATRLVHSPSTNLSARFHDASPDAFHRACFESIRTGIGFPAIFNDHVNIPMLESLGIPAEEARDYALVGCVETVVPGRQQPWGDSRFDAQLIIGRTMAEIESLPTYAAFWERFLRLQEEAVRAHCDTINAAIASAPPDQFPDPLLSALTLDCVARARDINDGGARYRRCHGVGYMSLATVTDSLMAVRKLVYEQRKLAPRQLREALEADFQGHEPVRQMLLNGAPKYGNDDDEVDAIAVAVVDAACAAFLRRRTVDGGWFQACMATNVSNIPAGAITPATPDGRHAQTPLSDAASPAFGRDEHGPTAVIASISKPDYTRCNCSVVNMRFLPDFFQGEAGARFFGAITRTFVRNRIQEMQFNFSDEETLEKALADPEAYRDLLVRVSGFSAYFTQLDKTVQHDIMRRRAHRPA